MMSSLQNAKNEPKALEELVLRWLARFDVSGRMAVADAGMELDGDFSLHPGGCAADLYGMLDAAYTLFTLGKLESLTSRESRTRWAERILGCQDETGWFTRLNARGHAKEHATAYAIGALRLLESIDSQRYVEQMRPLEDLREIVENKRAFEKWIRQLGFCSLTDIPRKNVGWHHVWRGSHVGGGVAAIIGMAETQIADWWGEDNININLWFDWYFEWLDRECNPATGLWQRAFYNRFLRKATILDLGGAAHFHWIYQARKRPIPYPEKVIESVVSLQKPTGLYKERPMCIDLDAMNSLIRCFLQLNADGQERHKERVCTCVQRNHKAILGYLVNHNLLEVYPDSHGLPGALIALAEMAKFPEYAHVEPGCHWEHVLDKVWWL